MFLLVFSLLCGVFWVPFWLWVLALAVFFLGAFLGQGAGHRAVFFGLGFLGFRVCRVISFFCCAFCLPFLHLGAGRRIALFGNGLFGFTPWGFNHCVYNVFTIHTLCCHTWFSPLLWFPSYCANCLPPLQRARSFLHQHIFVLSALIVSSSFQHCFVLVLL